MGSYNDLDMSNWYGYFPYKPSKAAAAIIFIVFLALFILNLTDVIIFSKKHGHKYSYQSLGSGSINQHKSLKKEMKKNKRYVTNTLIPLLISIIWECISYITRAIAAGKPDSLTVYIISQILNLVAPSAMAGSIYMIFGRLKTFLDANEYALIRSRFFTGIMVTIDVLCALMQASGSYLMTTDSYQSGFDLAIASFAAQIFLFGLYIIIALRFMMLLNRNPTRRCSFIDQGSLTEHAPQWRKVLLFSLLAMTFIVFRCILRLAEFIGGLDGVMSTKELVFYFIDAVPIMIASSILISARSQYVLWDLASYRNWDEKQDGHELNDLSQSFAEYNEQHAYNERRVL